MAAILDWCHLFQKKRRPGGQSSEARGTLLEWFNLDQIFRDGSWHNKEAVCMKQKKVTGQILRNLTFTLKSRIFGPFWPPVGPLGQNSKFWEKNRLEVFTQGMLVPNFKKSGKRIRRYRCWRTDRQTRRHMRHGNRSDRPKNRKLCIVKVSAGYFPN